MNGEYRKGVGIFLLNKENKLWVGKRIDFKSNFWQMPQGGIDKNETPRQAMVRELGEEVGVTKNFKIIDETKKGKKPKSGSYKGRLNSAPEIKRSTLNDLKNA